MNFVLLKILQNSSSRKFFSNIACLTRIPQKNYYKILGVNGSATNKEIKAAYIRLVKLYHPDTNGVKTKKHFQDIAEAYQVLSDRQRRVIYDRYGVIDKKRPEGKTISTSEYFRDLSKHQNVLEKVDAQLTFLQAIRGGKQTVRIVLAAPCRACEGIPKGKFVEKCKTCNGKGTIKMQKDVKINLPENTKNGDTVDIPSPLEPTKTLRLLLKVSTCTEFRQEGFNVHSNVEISLSQALLGDNVSITSVYGDHKLRIPPGCQCNTVLKLPGRGFRKSTSSTEAGDHFVKVTVVIPRKLTRAQMEIIREFAKTEIAPKNSPF